MSGIKTVGRAIYDMALGKRDRCPRCGGDAADSWFDRSLCPCADVMHTRCVNCGSALDGCPYDEGDA